MRKGNGQLTLNSYFFLLLCIFAALPWLHDFLFCVHLMLIELCGGMENILAI